MNRMLPPLLATIFALIAAACSTGPARPDRAAQQRPALYSPNGEPLSGGILGHPSCSDAIEGWYRRVNAKGGGMMSSDEFLADTKAQFDRMDLDHDGYITSAELSVFREPFQDPAPKDEPRDRRRERPAPTQARDGADPVMSADRNLNFRVNLDDFQVHAQALFSALDAGRKGHLTLGDVQAVCRNNGNAR